MDCSRLTGFTPPGGHLWTEIGGGKEKASPLSGRWLTHTRTLGGFGLDFEVGRSKVFFVFILKVKDDR